MGRLHLGTSGYSYQHWKHLFYPKGLAADGWLEFYAQVFSSVELNTTFYRLPDPKAVARWRDTVPPGFSFAAKGSRFLTHMKRLTDTSLGLDRFYKPVRQLQRKLSVVLWQVPPQMKEPDLERLDHFLAAQPSGLRQAFEFRDAGWYVSEVCDVLDKHGVAFCEHDLVDKRPPRHTGGFRYLRFHGAAGKYQGRYGRRALRPVSKDLDGWRAHADAYVYFNNDRFGHALADALDLADLLDVPTARELVPALS